MSDDPGEPGGAGAGEATQGVAAPARTLRALTLPSPSPRLDRACVWAGHREIEFKGRD